MLSDAAQNLDLIAIPVADAATLLHLPESAIRDAIHSHDLPALRFGARIRIAVVDLRLWAAGSTCLLCLGAAFMPDLLPVVAVA